VTRGAAPRGLLDGEPIDRRRAIRVLSGALLALGTPAALAACGRTVPLFVDRVGYQLDASLGEGNAPLRELVPLLTARARALGVDPVLNQVPPGRLAAMLREQTALGNYSAQTNKRAPVNRLVVTSAVEPATIEPIAAKAAARGVKIVAFPRPLRHQSAAVVFDTASAAATLAGDAAGWAHERLDGQAPAMLVLPAEESAAENALAAEAAAIEQTWRSTLARAAPGLQLSTYELSAGELGGADSLAPIVREQGIRVVLAWSDEVASGIARALRERPPSGVDPRDLYVGALGAPTIVSHATVDELDQDGPLRLVIAARLSELAGALVELPHALLHERTSAGVTLAQWRLTPRSSSLASYARDYAAHPSRATVNYEAVSLNPSAYH